MHADTKPPGTERMDESIASANLKYVLNTTSRNSTLELTSSTPCLECCNGLLRRRQCLCVHFLLLFVSPFPIVLITRLAPSRHSPRHLALSGHFRQRGRILLAPKAHGPLCPLSCHPLLYYCLVDIRYLCVFRWEIVAELDSTRPGNAYNKETNTI